MGGVLPAAAAPHPARFTPAARRRRLAPYLLVAGPVLYLLTVVVYPMAYAVALSLQYYRVGGFAGLHNFAFAFQDSLLAASLKATLTYIVIVVGVELAVGLALAVAVQRTIQSVLGRTLAYLLFIVPMVTPPVAAGVSFRLMYIPEYGILNVILHNLGYHGKPILWMSSPGMAMFSVVSVDVWQWMPFVFLVLFAGLQAVPPDVIEAAEMDGAGGWARFRQIDFPYLRPLLLLVLVFRLTDTLRVFDHIQVLTMGGPGAATEFLSLYLYKIAFKFSNLNYASALAIYIVLVISIIFALFGRYLSEEVA
ncbi:MAG TPA: sugar ABC transporter permease [bacterium]|nr:sugar ABC transporter permease [bacterium]